MYRVDAPLVELLDERLGPPLDSYVRGWQVWLEDQGPNGERLEWRLHPPAGFVMPDGVDHHDLFDVVLQRIADGGEDLAATNVWEILEVFPADGDPLDPRVLGEIATRVLGRAPDAAGFADHDRLGGLFKGRRGDFSVGRALLDALDPW